MATANEKRTAVRDKYKTIIGRNKYSQTLRTYCYKKYSDGKYYSDCSSSIMKTYQEAGFPISSSCLNTVGMYQASNLKKVDVVIKNGIIQNLSVLRIGDMLLFAGTDSSRAYVDCVGHVEMVGEINGSTVYIYGHGSGTPRRTEMNAYCNSRYSAKTSTKIGNKGLLKVVRFIQDDGAVDPTVGSSTAAPRTLKKGMIGDDVRDMQRDLIAAGYDVGDDGADGDFGENTEKAVKAFQKNQLLTVDGEYGPTSRAEMEKVLAMLGDAAEKIGHKVVVQNCQSAYIRTGPGTQFSAVGTCTPQNTFEGIDVYGWVPVLIDGVVCWISAKYAKLKA